ncbi:hypothetical protein BD408DRAFT_421220 [Parasitella parasitica]|nr:hypothetical protein BD408DRAFT_421220 [Parasitella parasitica]
MHQSLLLKLPHEVLLYILKQYLNPTDLWTLTRASKDLRSIALLMLKKQWCISSNSMLRSQINAAMIATSDISHRIIKRITIYDPYAFPPRLPQSPRNWLFLTLTDTTVYDLAIYQHPLPCQSISETRPPSPPDAFPPTIEPGLDEGNEYGFAMERIRYQCKRLHYIIENERRLHYQIVRSIVRENMSTVVETIFHHVVFVNSRGIAASSRRQSPITISKSRAFSAATTRLLCSLGANFKNEVAVMVWENMATFITYIEYRLLAKSNDTNLYDTITVFLNFVCACYVARIIQDQQALNAVQKIYHVTSKKYQDQTRRSLRELWLRTDQSLEDSALSVYLSSSKQ